MRVLHVMLSGGLGGVQAAFVNYTKLLCELGHDTVCCTQPGAKIASRFPGGVRTVSLPNSFEHDPLAIFRAVRMLRSIKPDVVLVHGKRALVIFAAARRFAGRSIPLVNVLHRHRFKRIGTADMSICVSKRLCVEAEAHGIDRRKLAHVPNFLTELWPTAPEQEWRKPPVIGFLGRLVPEKGADLFIEALKILKDQGVPFKAHIGGDGDLKPSLMALASERGLAADIVWRGWVDDVQGFYDELDLCCVPSRWESFGIVVLLAFNAGKALVATRTVGPGEIITDGRNGLLCDITPEDIAAKLKTLIEDRALAARLAAQGHSDRQNYTMAVIAPQVDAILRNAVHDTNHDVVIGGSSVATDALN